MKNMIENDLEGRRPTFMRVGLIAGLALSLMAFEYTTYGPDLKSNLGDVPIEFIETDLPPLVILRKEKTPEPEPEVKKKTDPNTFKKVEKFEKIERKKRKTINTSDQKTPQLASLDRINATDTSDEDVEPVRFIPNGDMPYFSFCGENSSSAEKKICTEQKFIEHLRKNIRIPRDINGAHKAFVSFVVNRKGKVSDVKMLNDVAPSLKIEIVRVLEKMPVLIPGQQGGKKVPVIYSIPVSVKRI